MNSFQKISKILAMPIIFTWILMTLFVDIIAVPTVFRYVSKVEEAGKVGMTVFTTFNRLEVVFALLFISAAVYYYKKQKNNFFLIISLVLFIWSLSYNIYFTPQIIKYTHLIRTAVIGDPNMLEYQRGHHFFHQLYRYLDTTKLIMLLSILVTLFRREWSEEK